MSELWTAAAAAALSRAKTLAADAGHGYVGTEHLLCALLFVQSDSAAPCIAAKLLSARGITYEKTIKLLPAAQSRPGGGDAPSMTPSLMRICRRAQEEAARFRLAEDPVTQNAVAGTEHLLFSLLCESDTVAAHILAAQNVPLHELYGDVLSFLSAASAEAAIFAGGTRTAPKSDLSDDDSDVRFAGGREAEKSSAPPDALPYLTDMTEAARRGRYDAVIGRDAETDAVLRILLRRGKNNPCLLGDAGVGKTAVVEGLAQRIAAGAVPSALKQARILSLSLGTLLAGTRYRGEFEERLRTVLQFCDDAEQSGTPVILFLDEVHMLMGAGAAEGAADAANLLKPALSRGDIRVIGATTPSEYDKTIAQDAAMARRFQTVTVEEPSADDAAAMLRALVPKLEAHHGVVISEEAVLAAIRLSVRYLPEFCLPDKAIDTLDDACAAAAARLHGNSASPALTPRESRDAALLSGDLPAAKAALAAGGTMQCQQVPPTRPTVAADDIAQAIRTRTGIALTAEEDEERRILQLETLLSAEIFGQDAAIRIVSTAIRRLRAGLSDPRRPAASFLFSGPSGVGKTALCIALARILFGSEGALQRFDMSEYMERHAVSRLIGAPPGYVGYEAGGTLTDAVRHRPYSLLLFDEIEKAHPDVMHLFLQLLDDGHLTDSRGRRVDFRSCIVVMTTNAGAAANTQIGFSASPDTRHTAAEAALSGVFPPELLGRFDAVVPFLPLDADARRRIVRSLLDDTATRLSDLHISLHITDEAADALSSAADGDASSHGARSLRRLLAQRVDAPLAAAILAGEIRRGDTAQIVLKNGEIAVYSENKS